MCLADPDEGLSKPKRWRKIKRKKDKSPKPAWTVVLNPIILTLNKCPPGSTGVRF